MIRRKSEGIKRKTGKRNCNISEEVSKKMWILVKESEEEETEECYGW